MDEFAKLSPSEFVQHVIAWVNANQKNLVRFENKPTFAMHECGYYPIGGEDDGRYAIRESHSLTSTKIEVVFDC
jgi:hypothetical protein